MKLAIFGGSGRTGQILIRQALAAGHEISALARTPEKIPAAEHLRVVQGDLDSPGAIAAVVAGARAVISVLGPADKVLQHLIATMAPGFLPEIIRPAAARIDRGLPGADS